MYFIIKKSWKTKKKKRIEKNYQIKKASERLARKENYKYLRILAVDKRDL